MIQIIHITIFLILNVSFYSCGSPDKRDSDYDLEMKAYRSFESEDFKVALKYYDELLGRDSLNGSYFFGRGCSYMMLDTVEKAINDFKMSVKLNYMPGSSYFNLALMHTHVEDSVALQYFKKAINIDPFDKKFQKKYEECRKRLEIDSIRQAQ